MATIYKAISVTPANKEFEDSVRGTALLLKKEDKAGGKLAVVNLITREVIWVTSDVKDIIHTSETHVVQTENSVYTFEKIGETV